MSTVGTLQNTAYYERMSAALGDKSRILPDIQGRKVLDIGAGGGDLSYALAQEGYEVTALDVAPHSVVPEHTNLTWAQGWSDEISNLNQQWDTIVACAVLHEVYSYGTGNGPANMVDFERTIAEIHDSLAPGGRFIIRDGIKPKPGNATLKFIQQKGMLSHIGMAKYREYSPFSVDSPFHVPHMREVSIRCENGIWYGSTDSIMEALYTINWGNEGFVREVQELYGLFTLEEYKAEIERFGFTCIRAEQYLQPGYVDALSPYVEVKGFEESFPYSNAVLVFEKV